MRKAILFPGKYIQGEHVLEELGALMEPYRAKNAMVVWDTVVRSITKDTVLASLSAAGIQTEEAVYDGLATRAAADEYAQKARETGCSVIIGIGGGKAQDLAKAVAAQVDARTVVCPTSAACDAATSSCTVFYKEDGSSDGVGRWANNPDLVLVDTSVCAKEPERLFKAGIADALATYVEAEACYDTHARANSGASPTLTAIAMAKLCYDTLLEYAPAALDAVRAGLSTPIFERTVEALILLSGIGWESGGVCTAHVLGNFLGAFPETHGFMHGEKVAFGIATQLMLDPDLPMEQINRIFDFMIGLDLPVTLEDMHMQDVSRERILEWCVARCNAKIMLERHNFTVTPEGLSNAMFMADCYGKTRKQMRKHL